MTNVIEAIIDQLCLKIEYGTRVGSGVLLPDHKNHCCYVVTARHCLLSETDAPEALSLSDLRLFRELEGVCQPFDYKPEEILFCAKDETDDFVILKGAYLEGMPTIEWGMPELNVALSINGFPKYLHEESKKRQRFRGNVLERTGKKHEEILQVQLTHLEHSLATEKELTVDISGSGLFIYTEKHFVFCGLLCEFTNADGAYHTINAISAKRLLTHIDSSIKCLKITSPDSSKAPAQSYELSSAIYSSCTQFVKDSRKAEIQKLNQLVERKYDYIYIYGLGGIGKTELAIKWAEQFNQKSSSRKAVFLNYSNSIQETILNLDIRNYHYDEIPYISTEENRKRNFDHRLEILEKHFPNWVLVIDNFYDETKTLEVMTTEPDYLRLKSKQLTCIFTTRYTVSYSSMKEIQAMGGSTLLKLIRSHYPENRWADRKRTEDVLRKLISVVNNHTQTIVLIARLLEEAHGTIRPDDLLKELSLIDPKQTKKVREDDRKIKAANPEEEKLIPVIQKLRQLMKISALKSEESILLSFLSLISDEGIRRDVFETAASHIPNSSQWIDHLISLGWINYITTRKNTVLIVHPVIRKIATYDINPEQKKVHVFLDSLYQTMPMKRTVLRQAEAIFQNAKNEIDPKYRKKERRCTTWLWHYDELKYIQKRIRPGQCFFIYGPHGVGKTELARSWALWKTRSTGTICKAAYQRSIYKTIASMDLPGAYQDWGEHSSDEIFQQPFNYLKAHPEDVLILDDIHETKNTDTNPDTINDFLFGDPDYTRLTELNNYILCTTREMPKGLSEDQYLYIAPKSLKSLMELMRRYCHFLDNNEMKELIKAVEKNTLLVALLAKNLNKKNYKNILSELQRSENQYVTLLNQFITTEKEQDLMTIATLFPDNGINSVFLEKIADEAISEEEKEKARNSILNMVKGEWLLRKDDRILIQNTIRRVCMKEFHPTDANCQAFLDAVFRVVILEKYDQDYDVICARQASAVLSRAANRLEDRNGLWAEHASELYQLLGNYQRAISYGNKALAQIRKIGTPLDLARIHQRLAYQNSEAGRPDKAIMEIRAAIECLTGHEDLSEITEDLVNELYTGIWEKDAHYPYALAKIYNQLGIYYGKTGSYLEELDAKLFACDTREEFQNEPYSSVEELVERKKEIARSYNDLAYAYEDIASIVYDEKQEQEAMEAALYYRYKALELREEIFAQEPFHPELAKSYSNLGETLYQLGEYEQAWDSFEQAKEIREKSLPKKHPDLAYSYYSLAVFQHESGNLLDLEGKAEEAAEKYQQAMIWYKKALRIRRECFSPNHPVLLENWKSMGLCMMDLENYKKAMTYLTAALEGYEARIQNGLPTIKNDQSERDEIQELLERCGGIG